jgi:uncharacterized protein (TIGR03435 family)
MKFGPGTLSAGSTTMSTLAAVLTASGAVERVVVDRTGLTGHFDIELRWTPTALPPAAASGDDLASDAPSIFTAAQEQLGLKLESTTGPVDVLVIDHVEHPTED